MPYIDKISKVQVDAHGASNPGELNYDISRRLVVYKKRRERSGKKGYELLNEIIGVLESAKQEFYRRVVMPYEDEKRKERGRVDPYKG